MENFKYHNDAVSKGSFQKICDDMPNHQVTVSCKEVEQGLILPSRHEDRLPWGLGGVFDCRNNFIEESGVYSVFGGWYDCGEENIDYCDDTIFFCGILPLHWGHFLVDYVSRLWAVYEYEEKFKIAYIHRAGEHELSKNIKDFLEFAGISEDRLLCITKPTIFKKILVPSSAFGGGYEFNAEKYTKVVDVVKKNALLKAESEGLKRYEKIYFTRRKYTRKDIGEKEIENAFRINGFHVMAPEKLSTLEQIFYINKADVLAPQTGTVSHNYMFAKPDAEIILLNRFPVPNPCQLKIDYIFNLNTTWIDVYKKHILKLDVNYGSPQIWIEFNENLKAFFLERGLKLPQHLLCASIVNWGRYIYYWKLYWPIKMKIRSIKNILKK